MYCLKMSTYTVYFYVEFTEFSVSYYLIISNLSKKKRQGPGDKDLKKGGGGLVRTNSPHPLVFLICGGDGRGTLKLHEDGK